MRITTKEIFTIPNCLSYIRLGILPFFIYFYIQADEPSEYLVAAVLILFSGLTDLLDGMIARQFNQITELGKTLDPVADKLQQAAIAFCLMFKYEYMWILVILFVVKELFMGINGLILLKRGKKLDGAQWFGKVSTAVFYLATLFLIAFPDLDANIAGLLIFLTGTFLGLSFILYIPMYIKMYRIS